MQTYSSWRKLLLTDTNTIIDSTSSHAVRSYFSAVQNMLHTPKPLQKFINSFMVYIHTSRNHCSSKGKLNKLFWNIPRAYQWGDIKAHIGVCHLGFSIDWADFDVTLLRKHSQPGENSQERDKHKPYDKELSVARQIMSDSVDDNKSVGYYKSDFDVLIAEVDGDVCSN